MPLNHIRIPSEYMEYRIQLSLLNMDANTIISLTIARRHVSKCTLGMDIDDTYYNLLLISIIYKPLLIY